MALQPDSGLGKPVFRFVDYTLGWTPTNQWPIWRKVHCTYTTQETNATKIHAHIGIVSFSGATAQRGPGPPNEVSRSHTITHSHSVGLLWTSDRPVAEIRTYSNTQHSEETNIHASGGIRTRDPSNRAAVDLCFRPHGYRNQPTDILNIHNYQSFHVKIKLVVVSYSGGKWFKYHFGEGPFYQSYFVHFAVPWAKFRDSTSH